MLSSVLQSVRAVGGEKMLTGKLITLNKSVVHLHVYITLNSITYSLLLPSMVLDTSVYFRTSAWGAGKLYYCLLVRW
jgi:hypothetical protein